MAYDERRDDVYSNTYGEETYDGPDLDTYGDTTEFLESDVNVTNCVLRSYYFVWASGREGVSFSGIDAIFTDKAELTELLWKHHGYTKDITVYRYTGAQIERYDISCYTEVAGIPELDTSTHPVLQRGEIVATPGMIRVYTENGSIIYGEMIDDPEEVSHLERLGLAEYVIHCWKLEEPKWVLDHPLFT